MNCLFFRGFFAIGCLFLFTGCQSSREPVVAKVGDYAITLADFKSRLHDTPSAYQQYATTPEGQRQFLNLMIREKVLLVESRKEGLQKDPNYRKALDQFKKKVKRDLKDYQESLLIEMYLARLRTKNITVTDAEVRRYYDDHLTDFMHPVEIQASHILVRTPEEAERVLARLKRGDSFEALARAVSMDPPTAARGGKLAPFTKGSLMPEFENAVVPLKDGEVSGVVKSPFGYHVIKKNSQKKLPPRPFEGTIVTVDGAATTVPDLIRRQLQRQKFDEWVTKAQASLDVKIDEQELAGVSSSPMTKPERQAGTAAPPSPSSS